MSNEPNPPQWLVWLAGLVTALVMGLAAQPPKDEPVEPAPLLAAELIEATDEPTPAWLTWPEAHREHVDTGRPVLVVVGFPGCRPCERLKRLLDKPENYARFAALGIPCVGHCRDWQTEDKTKWRAPAVHRFDGGEEAAMLAGLDFTTADKFFNQLEEWIDAL